MESYMKGIIEMQVLTRRMGIWWHPIWELTSDFSNDPGMFKDFFFHLTTISKILFCLVLMKNAFVIQSTMLDQMGWKRLEIEGITD